jgi:hypothetical protein
VISDRDSGIREKGRSWVILFRKQEMTGCGGTRQEIKFVSGTD